MEVNPNILSPKQNITKLSSVQLMLVDAADDKEANNHFLQWFCSHCSTKTYRPLLCTTFILK
jgi:hypothetical protein